VPQAFTHGTLVTLDNDASARFYTEVLGLAAFRAYAHVNYVHHPSAKHFLVCVPRGTENHHGPAFRNTLSMESRQDLEEGRRWLASVAGTYGVAEIGDVQADDGQASLLIQDLDANWWEIVSPA
jgi:catechol 2,3-dioxygenase-like lactoylglutathione lyase family enzyme